MSVKQKVNGQLVNIAGGSPTNASSVAYDNTTSGLEAENTQDAIDEIKSDLSALQNYTIGNAVNLTSYTSIANSYTAPSDGYLSVSASATNGVIDGNAESISIRAIYINKFTVETVFVKKGMRLYVPLNQGSGNTAYFYPLKSST